VSNGVFSYLVIQSAVVSLLESLRFYKYCTVLLVPEVFFGVAGMVLLNVVFPATPVLLYIIKSKIVEVLIAIS
jgi:hypothetical protein